MSSLQIAPTLAKTLFVALIVFQPACANTPKLHQAEEGSMRNAQIIGKFELSHSPWLGTTSSGKKIDLGGFSGLIYEGEDPKTHELLFLTHTDRGPNAPSFRPIPGGRPVVPFLLPDFQPEWVRMGLDLSRKTFSVRGRVPLWKSDGTAVTGLPNIALDEKPVEAMGTVLPLDPMGLDLEGIARDRDGSYWMGDEYRPSLCHFRSDGVLLDRWIPKKFADVPSVGAPFLPEHYARRQMNRGFEGIAYRSGKIYAFLQSPLEQEAGTSQVIRILEMDAAKKQATGEYVYWLEDRYNDRKIGDIVALSNGRFLVLEQTSEKGIGVDKKIFLVDLTSATNLLQLASDVQNSPLEALSPAELEKKGIRGARKSLFLDLGKLGYNEVEKAEGLAVVDSKTIAVIGDNDFGLNGEPKSQLWLFRLDLPLK